MNLFARQEHEARLRVQPLAARMRPRTLDEFVGQSHFLGPGKLLRRMIQADRLGSMLFSGPPGCGKTSLAELIARQTRRKFVRLNAVSSGVKELRAELDAARERFITSQRGTILFIDEIHRFNRTQQDALLPDVEDGTISLIGATTENPFFAVVAPLVSRSQLFQFQSLTEAEIRQVIDQAVRDPERGFGKRQTNLGEEALAALVRMAAGDARRALRILEIAVLSVEENTPITPEIIEESAQQKLLRHDRSGDAHYDLASALIKSIRGSDPDSALYWMARMIAGGEDPRFIARRLVIAAAEDIGNADPQALIIAQATADAVAFIGLPEGRIPLAQAAIYLALAPKSNSTISSIDAALEDVRSEATLPVPKPLRDAHYPGAKALGHGTEYQNPHRSPEGFLPDAGGGVGRQYYEPVRRGREIELAERLDEIRRRRAEQSGRDLDAAEE